MKQCTKCKEVKTFDLFAKRSLASDGLASWCKQCYAEHAAWVYQNNEAERARKKRNKLNIRKMNQELVLQYLLEHPCVDCGNSDVRVLEFDHRDRTGKTWDVCGMFDSSSWATIEYEIAKCDVRCANCHRIRTQDQFGTWRSRINDGA